MKPAIRWSDYQQLELIPASVRRHPSWRDYLRHFYQQAIARLGATDSIEVWQVDDGVAVTWSAIDRETGRSIHQVSENQLRIWLERRHLS